MYTTGVVEAITHRHSDEMEQHMANAAVATIFNDEAPKAPALKRGRKRTHASLKMSEACFRRFHGIGSYKKQKLREIADHFNSLPGRAKDEKTFSDRAVHQRIQNFMYRDNPILANELLGSLNEPVAASTSIKNITPKKTVTKSATPALTVRLTSTGGELVLV